MAFWPSFIRALYWASETMPSALRMSSSSASAPCSALPSPLMTASSTSVPAGSDVLASAAGTVMAIGSPVVRKRNSAAIFSRFFASSPTPSFSTCPKARQKRT